MIEPMLERFQRYWVDKILDTAKGVAKHREMENLTDSDVNIALDMFSKYFIVFLIFCDLDQRFTETVPFRGNQQKELAREVNSKPLPKVDQSSLLHTPKAYIRTIFPDYVRREPEEMMNSGQAIDSRGNLQQKSINSNAVLSTFSYK